MPYSNFLIYGARAGLQKAIRRGDVSLAKTCFDIIWSESKHRQWLTWRVAVLVYEDCWTMAGELAKFQAESKGKKGDDRYQAWLKFIIRLTIAIKNQDAAHLWYLVVHGGKDYAHPEFTVMKQLSKLVTNDEPGKVPFVDIKEVLDKAATHVLSQYELDAIQAVDARRRSGGMESDQWNAMSAMVLIYLRGLSEASVEGMIAGQKEKYARAGERVRTLPELPLYCFDMHTRTGLLAGRVFLKNHKTKLLWDNDHLMTSWFQFESAAMTDKVRPQYCTYSDDAKPSWKECMWEDAKLKSLADWYGVSVNEMIDHWNQNREKMYDLIAWAVSKTKE